VQQLAALAFVGKFARYLFCFMVLELLSQFIFCQKLEIKGEIGPVLN
jgi:hypothetical protein